MVFFFLPYRNDMTPLQAINAINKTGVNSTAFIVDVLLNFALPVVLTLLAALMMALRVSIPKCIFAAIFCLIATAIYSTLNSDGADVGFIANRAIAIVGIILPIVNIILLKVFPSKKTATEI